MEQHLNEWLISIHFLDATDSDPPASRTPLMKGVGGINARNLW